MIDRKTNEEIFIERLFNQELEDIYYELKQISLAELKRSVFAEDLKGLNISMVKNMIIDICKDIIDKNSEHLKWCSKIINLLESKEVNNE